MEIIRNYLESMFANMPRTPEVERARAELLQMMEDKYNELRAEGKNENEAVGTVISEFGNLDELAEALGLEKEVEQEHEQSSASAGRLLYMDEVKDYIQFCGIRAMCIALGIALCIACVSAPIMFERYEGIGVSIMMLMIAAAVALFVLMGVYSRKWSYIHKGACSIDYATAEWLKNEKERYGISYAAQLVVGIMLCALCWLPFVVVGSSHAGSFAWNMLTVLFFAFIAVGVFLIVHTALVMKSYTTLLKLNDVATMSGSYSRGAVPEYASAGAERVMSVYWHTVRNIYLIWSFVTFDWWRTWVIWPVAGILYAILKSFTVKKE